MKGFRQGHPEEETQSPGSWTPCLFPSQSQMIVPLLWPRIDSNPLEGCNSSGAVCSLPSVSSQIDHIFTLAHLPLPASQRATQSYSANVLAASGIHFENEIRTKDKWAPPQNQQAGSEAPETVRPYSPPTVLPEGNLEVVSFAHCEKLLMLWKGILDHCSTSHGSSFFLLVCFYLVLVIMTLPYICSLQQRDASEVCHEETQLP